MTREPAVAILLCTKNGEKFLREQLESFEHQTYKNLFLVVSDDGSADNTPNILNSFAQGRPRNTMLRKGPRQGACVNFLSLATDPSIDAEYFAFSDQDDIWHQDKLQRARDWLITIPVNVPALYCARTEIVRIDGQADGLSPLFSQPPTFRNALVQNIAGGNTMVFNRASKRLLESAGRIRVISHDWWTYQLISGAGGAIRYDPKPVIKYRQHGENLVGSNATWLARIARVRMMLWGRFREWNTLNIAALRSLPTHLIRPENRAVIEQFARARSSSLLKRLNFFWASGVYRQTFLGNLGLLAATILKRI